MPRKLTCRELIEFLMDYLDDALGADERESFAAHLAVCPDCVRYVDDYRSTVRAGRSAFADPDAPTPDAVPESLVAAILAARRGD
jgi:anti-sigma factor RsiW